MAKAKQHPPLHLPPELAAKIRDHYIEENGIPADRVPPALPVKSEDWSDFRFGNYMIIPENTAGSDDYHEYRLAITHNVRVAFECDLDYFLAKATVYEKVDPAQPAYFVVSSHYERDFRYIVVEWA